MNPTRVFSIHVHITIGGTPAADECVSNSGERTRYKNFAVLAAGYDEAISKIRMRLDDTDDKGKYRIDSISEFDNVVI